MIADATFPDNHPLKVGALIRLASLQAARGNLDAARASFERSGLSAEQCALLDSSPKLRRTNSSSSDFPREALFWGFEGWTRLQYDIAADGTTIHPRVVLAYPPFVFSDSGTAVVEDLEYEARFRPGNALGCGGVTLGVTFRMPR